MGFVGLQKHLTKPSTWEGGFGAVQTAEGFPLGGSWHGRAVTDEGAGPGQLSVRRHLIRPFGPPSPQGEGFQNVLLFAKPQFAGMARRGKAPALRRTCGSIPFRSNEKGLPGLNRKSFSFVKREKEMKMRGFANGVPLWNIFIIPAN